MADAGSSGWRTFEDFKTRVIDRSQTRVVAFLNIVGLGMREGQLEQSIADMEVKQTAAMAMKYKGTIIGIKSAHFAGPEWTPYERAEEVGKMASIPVMVDFGSNQKMGRTIMELVTKYFRPGDIYTHMYGGVRGEYDEVAKGPSAAMIEGRKRGVKFDVGHGGGSFKWVAAMPMIKAGFVPDSISTDLHTGSMNGGMKTMVETMSKFLAAGQSLADIIKWSTDNPAKQIQLPELGHLSVGAGADIAVLRVEKGKFGYVDQNSTALRVDGTERLSCEVTLRDGQVLYDLNGDDERPRGTPTVREAHRSDHRGSRTRHAVACPACKRRPQRRATRSSPASRAPIQPRCPTRLKSSPAKSGRCGTT